MLLFILHFIHQKMLLWEFWFHVHTGHVVRDQGRAEVRFWLLEYSVHMLLPDTSVSIWCKMLKQGNSPENSSGLFLLHLYSGLWQTLFHINYRWAQTTDVNLSVMINFHIVGTSVFWKERHPHITSKSESLTVQILTFLTFFRSPFCTWSPKNGLKTCLATPLFPVERSIAPMVQ